MASVAVAAAAEYADSESSKLEDVEQQHRPQPPTTAPPPLGPYDYPLRSPLKGSLSGGCPAPPWCCYRKKVGRFYVLHENSHGEPVCMVGPCWPMFLVTFTLIASIASLVTYGLGKNYIEIIVIGSVLLAITLLAFTLTACRNPGIVPRRQEQRGNDELYDERALSYRPYGSVFEYETGTLIRNVDHFCPWTSTVIAGANIISFRIFTTTLCVLLIFVIIITILWGGRVIQI